ncbi:CheR family methyltransferase [Deinococcus navajonensis]|uniref:protein-glutamate O-methyltransferase n=1 Tax=Deinococcus navajonensis TaxID=309884 RepID=A0ABV8XLH2_9DEIO
MTTEDLSPALEPELNAAGPARLPVAIVGVGGSAGALDGYERLFTAMPAGSGLAFVVVPHLSPQQGADLMPDLLRRCTMLPVVAAEDGEPVQADHVYVAPPGHTLGLTDGRFQLTVDPHPHQPIDAFFASLAADQGERAVAVVLSGTGMDGSRGIQVIKQHLGVVLVQDPGTAQYPGMPQSALSTGMADHVLPAEDLAAELYAQATRTPALRYPDAFTSDGRPSAALKKVLAQVRQVTGHDFSQYKLSTLVRRIDRRMKGQQAESLEAYASLLQQNQKEVEELFRDFLINVTSFFRDPQAFALLQSQLRTYLQERPDLGVFRAWIAGCSTGQEAYSVAMLLREVADELAPDRSLQVQLFATDLDQDAIDEARMGLYSPQAVTGVSPQRLERFFVLHDGGYQVRSELREMMVFAPHNIFRDPPFTRLDLVTCRNMLIYFNVELQREILPLFHFALKPGGLLLLGPSETLGGSRDLFGSIDNRWKLSRREGPQSVPVRPLGHLSPTLAPLAPPAASRELSRRFAVSTREPSLAGHVQAVLLSEWGPPAVVVNAQGQVMYVSGRTGAYLELPHGSPNNNVTDLARPEVRYVLVNTLREAVASDQSARSSRLSVTVAGVNRGLEVVVRPLRLPGQPAGLYLIVFLDQGSLSQDPAALALPAEQHEQVTQLESELKHAKEYLQATVEEMEVALEERKSSYEELQTANEELQSSNEELMTSKEELQSLNEELSTINTEHHVIISDLQQANDDMKNLLSSVGIATVFLDNRMRVKRFTPRITDVINLMPVDIGRPLTDIASNLRYDLLADDIGRVLQTLAPFETEVQTRDDHWFLMRISPYRTFDNFIDGVVVIFTNIDVLKRLDGQLRDTLRYSDAILNAMTDPIVVLDQQLRVTSHNRALLDLVGHDETDIRGVRLYDLGQGQFDQTELISRLRLLSLGNAEVKDFILNMTVPGLGRRIVKLNARPLHSTESGSDLMLLWAEDVTPMLQKIAVRGADAIHAEAPGPEDEA